MRASPHTAPKGKTYVEVSAMMKVAYKTILDWIKKFKTKGVEELHDQLGRGCKPNLPKGQEKLFEGLSYRWEQIKRAGA